MTRTEVAERLGKSIATVRRLEGVLLHPALDHRGRRRFDRGEVEQLARGIDRGEIAVWQHMRDAAEPLKGIAMNDREHPQECAGCVRLQENLDRLSEELDAKERRYRREVEALRTERERERESHRAEQRELERELKLFVAQVMAG